MTHNIVLTVESLTLSSRAIPAALVLALLWMIESFRPNTVWQTKRLRHAGINLSLAVINGAVLFLTLGLASATLAKAVSDHRIGLLNWLGLQVSAQLMAGCLILDAWTYSWHRANHRLPFLWRFHRVHHSDSEMDVTTSARFHVGELAMAAVLRLPVIAIFGLSPASLVLHEIVLLAVSQFHHANISLGSFDRILRWFIVTPAMHRIHHSRYTAETNSNYSSILSIWDRVFGSHRHVDCDAEIRLGLDEFRDSHWQSLTGMLKTPFSNIGPANHPPTSSPEDQ